MISPGKFKTLEHGTHLECIDIGIDSGVTMTGKKNNIMMRISIKTQNKTYELPVISKKEDKPIERNDGFLSKCKKCIKHEEYWENEICIGFEGDSGCDDENCLREYNHVITLAMYEEEDLIYKMSKDAYNILLANFYAEFSTIIKNGIKYYILGDNCYRRWSWYLDNNGKSLLFQNIYIPIRIENNNIVLFSSEDNFKIGIRCTKEGFYEKMNEITFLSNLSERNLTKFMKLSLCKQQRFMWWSPPDKKGYRDSKSRRKLLFIVMMCSYKESYEYKLSSLQLEQDKTYSLVTQKYPSTVGLFIPITNKYIDNMFIEGLEILPPEIWSRVFSFHKHDKIPTFAK